MTMKSLKELMENHTGTEPLTLNMLDELMDKCEATDNSICTVRLKTSYWSDSNGVYTKKSLTYLRRKSQGYNLLKEEVSAVGAEDAVKIIENLYDCEDGIYEVVVCNERRDWEAGYIDQYDFKLVRVE